MAVKLPQGVSKKELTADFFNEYFWLNEGTGWLHWRPRSIDLFPNEGQSKVWHSRYAFKPAGGVSRPVNGYSKIQITLAKNTFSAHRIIALICGMISTYGDKRQVDHKDGNPLNNKPTNLRMVDCQQNQRNRSYQKNGVGVAGVNYHKSSRKWQASIGRGGKKSKLIGYYDDWFEAVCARKSEEKALGYSKRHCQRL